MHAGQGCAITTRLVVPRAKYDEAVSAAAAHDGRASRPATRPTPEPSAGPVISARQRDRVQGYLDSAIAEGGTFACGGGRPADRDVGFFIEPTVIAGLGNDARVAQEEIFGPVLTVIAHDGDDDAVRIANDSPYGLSGTVFGADPDRAARVASRMRVGHRSTSTVASGTQPMRHSAVTSNPGTVARWAWPVSRSTWKPRPLRQRSRLKELRQHEIRKQGRHRHRVRWRYRAGLRRGAGP